MHLDDPLTAEIIDVEDQLLGLRSPSGNYLEYLPFLHRLPLTPLAQKAASLRDRRDAYVLRLKEEIEQKIMMGTHRPCLYTKNHFSAHPLSTSFNDSRHPCVVGACDGDEYRAVVYDPAGNASGPARGGFQCNP